MSDRELLSGKRLSRRGFLYAGGGAVLGATLLASPAAASTKVSQGSVHYQPIPKGKARCATCALFQPPTSCKVVDGAISPSGSCTLYAPKG